MTTPDLPEAAVEAAARAWRVSGDPELAHASVETQNLVSEYLRSHVGLRAMLAAAAPHLRADERARVLDEVDAALLRFPSVLMNPREIWTVLRDTVGPAESDSEPLASGDTDEPRTGRSDDLSGPQ